MKPFVQLVSQFGVVLGLCGLLCGNASANVTTPTPRAMEWLGVPLGITLTPQQETILRLGDDVRVATPAHLMGKLSVSSLAGQIYLTPNQTFDRTRLQVERLSDGMTLLIDVDAKTGGITPPQIDIVLPSPNKKGEQTNEAQTLAHLAHLEMAPEALLVRYAMQNLYSPVHAIEPLPGVMRTPMNLPRDLQGNTFVKLHVRARPVAAWKLRDRVVTAISLTNLRSFQQTLDPRLVTLGGSCLLQACQVAFSHPQIGPMGSATEKATAFIVTPGPLSQHLLLAGGEHE